MVAFTFERLIVVRYPLKRPKMCTVRRAKIIIVCLAILALVVQALSLFATGVIDISSFTPTPQQQQQSRNVTLGVMRSNSTQPPAAAGQSKTNYRQLKRFIAMLETAATVVVPSVLIVIMNGLIIQSFRSNRPQASLNQFGRHFKTGANRHRSPSPSQINELNSNNSQVIFEKLNPIWNPFELF